LADLESLAQKAANIAMTTNGSGDQVTPMERWRFETAQHGPWNNIAAVQAGGERQPSDFREKPRDGSKGGDTSDGHDS